MCRKEPVFVATIFDDEPKQWGLRGDPYLWNDMREAFSKIAFPISNDDFTKQFKLLYIKFTGVSLTSDCRIFITQYSHGGLSSGQISSDFWNNQGLPMLLDRLKNIQ